MRGDRVGVGVCMLEMRECVCVWVAGCKLKDPGCAEMLRGRVCRPVVLQVIADISSFVYLIADLHCL